MKKFKRPINVLLLWIVAATGILPATAIAQNKEMAYTGKIMINPLHLERIGNLLFIELDIQLKDIQVVSTNSIELLPRLVSSSRECSLPEVSIKGRNNLKIYHRMLSLMSNTQKKKYQQPYQVVEGYHNRTTNISYRHSIPYEAWMADATLEVRYDDCGCGKNAELYAEQIAKVKQAEKKKRALVPHMAYLKPQVEEIKKREVQAEAFLDFVVNKTDIRPDYMNNPRELTKIRNMINELTDNKAITLKRIDIIGYASPEGTLAGNKRLSEGRAEALRNYLALLYSFPLDIYHVEFGGENWDGLQKKLEEQAMLDFKDEMLNIIQTTSAEKERKKLLMNLRGGDPYRYLLKNVYPGLRVAVCKASYSVKNFELEEAREEMTTHPQNLSLNEMFIVANSYPVGSTEFVDVFETAARLFPESSTANLNAALAALSRGDTVAGERYLGKVKTRVRIPELDNARGILAMLKGDYEAARDYLKAAANAGLKVAEENLEELEEKEQ